MGKGRLEEFSPSLEPEERAHLLSLLSAGESPSQPLPEWQIARLRLKLTAKTVSEYVAYRRVLNPRINQQEMAEEIGVTREALNRSGLMRRGKDGV